MTYRILPLLIVVMSLYGCSSTVVDKSARSREPAEVFEQQMKRASRFHGRGMNAPALRHYGEAIRSAQAFPKADPRRAEARTQRAELRLAMGDYQGAEADYRAVIKVERLRAGSRASQELADALNNLAVFLIDLGRSREAARLLYEALSNRTEVFGAEHPLVATLMQNLADTQRREKNYEVAEDLFVRALKIYALSDETYYRQASIAKNSLARVFAETHRPVQAEKNHIEAIRLSISVGGEHNPDVGVFSRDLANLYAREGRNDEAEDLYKGSIVILRQKLGEKSYQLSKTYRDYSAMLAAIGRRHDSANYAARADATGF